MSDWEELVKTAFVAALALFAFFFLKTADYSSVHGMAEGLERFFTAIILSLKPTGFSFAVDAVAALASGMVSFRAVGENVVAAIFGFLFLYFFLSISINYLFVAPGMV